MILCPKKNPQYNHLHLPCQSHPPSTNHSSEPINQKHNPKAAETWTTTRTPVVARSIPMQLTVTYKILIRRQQFSLFWVRRPCHQIGSGALQCEWCPLAMMPHRSPTVPRRETDGCAELRLLTVGSSHRLSLSGAEVFLDA